MVLDLCRSEAFAWRGGAVFSAPPPLSAVRRQARVRRRGGEGARIPRRFQPSLAAGFDDDAGDGLRDFDRVIPRVSVALMLMLVAGFCAASALSLLAVIFAA